MKAGVKRLLMVYDVPYPHIAGGGQRRLWEVGRRFVKSGWEVDWITFKVWDGDDIFVGSEGIRYIGLPNFRGLYAPNGRRRKLETLEFFWALHRYRIAVGQYNVVWSGQWPLIHLLPWLFFPKILGQALLVVDWWEIWGRVWLSYSRSVGWIGSLFENSLLRRCARVGGVICIAPQPFCMARRIAPNGRIALLHNGIPLNDINQLSCGEMKPYLLVYIGRLKEHKRVDLLIEAISILRKRHGLDARTLLIGDGPERAALQQLASERDVADIVEFAGVIEDNNEAYRRLSQGRIFVNPSVKEGGGSIALFEAYACGLPAIVFKCPEGIDPELIQNNETGILIESIDADALATAVYDLANNPDKLEKMSHSARAYARQFDWERIADDYRKVFESWSPSICS